MSFSLIRTCPHCGKDNRIPAAHLAHAGRCGSCKGALSPQSEPIDADDSSLPEIIRDATVPVLVDFWASWCGPCRMAAPEVKELARETAGKALILKVNTETSPQLSARYNIQSIPNFLVFRGGRPVFQQPGLVPRSQMRTWLET